MPCDLQSLLEVIKINTRTIFLTVNQSNQLSILSAVFFYDSLVTYNCWMRPCHFKLNKMSAVFFYDSLVTYKCWIRPCHRAKNTILNS